MESDKVTFFEKYKHYFLIAAVGFAVYLNSLFGPFVWDDIAQIESNYLVHSITNIGSFFLGSTFTPQNSTDLQGLYYRPIMTTAFSLIYTLFSTQTFFYHFFQLSVHILNALLVFYFFKKFFKQTLALILALVFVIHPINTEAVVYIATLGEPLFFLFGMLSLILFQKDKAVIKRNFFIGILLLCSLLSKETGVLFGIILFIYYLLFHKKSPLGIIQTLAITLIPLGLYLFLRFSIAQVFLERIPDVPMMTAPLAGRIFTMPAIFLFYIQTFIFPKDLFIYQQWMISQPNERFYIPFLFDMLFLIGITTLGVWIFRANRKAFNAFIFFTLWLLAGIGIHMQILPLDMTVADHMFYFPIIGLLGIIGIGIQNIKQPSFRIQQIGFTIAIIIICLLALRTFVRNTNWYNRITLYSNDLQYQQNDRLENLLAGELITAGKLNEAQIHFESLLSRNQKEPILYANLGQAYQFQGKVNEAKNTYKNGLIHDDTGALYAYLANILFKEGQNEQARKVSAQGLTRFPHNASLLLINAVSSYKLGDKKKSLEQIEKAKTISNDPRIEQFYQGIVNDNLKI
jgi:hypothetical protein